jgi:vancomycin resistance protein YoaR
LAALQLEGQVQAQLAAARLRRRRQARVRMLRRAALAGIGVLLLASIAVGFVYAGSPARIASGVRIAGVDVGGLSAGAARARLVRRAAAVASAPLSIRVGPRTFSVARSDVGVRPDWGKAAAEAIRRSGGFGPVRGLRRLYLRAFGSDLAVPVRVDGRKLDALVGRLAAPVDRPHRDAAVRLAGLRPRLVPGRAGVAVDRDAARRLLTAAIVSLDRDPVTLPLRRDPPRVSRADLVPVAAQVRTVLSAPVRLALGATRYRIPRWRLAGLLELPSHGARALRIAGPAADAYFSRLQKVVNTPPRDASFEPLPSGRVRVVPGVDGVVLDVPETAARLLAAARSTTHRVADIAVSTAEPKLTTAEAQRMGIREVVSSYETFFGGVPNRIHNVELVSHLIDNTLIAPGRTFSFNATTGDRNAAKGFLEAPVIINGELQTGLGGGVCQVSTTVFNAAYEAGLPITARTNHALYISHYPQGRDATVDYPDVDLRFVNDTGHWLLLRTWVSSSSLTVGLYGTNLHRRVVSDTAPLRVTGPPPVQRIKDPTLPKGKQVIVDPGSPSLATSVRRRVYAAGGKLLYDNVWYSSYRGTPEVIRVGTKKPKPKAKPGIYVPPAASLTQAARTR